MTLLNMKLQYSMSKATRIITQKHGINRQIKKWLPSKKRKDDYYKPYIHGGIINIFIKGGNPSDISIEKQKIDRLVF